YDALSRAMFLQKETRGQREIGYLTAAANQLYFDTIPVPDYSSAEKRRIVFLDNLEIDRMLNLEHGLGVWEKRPEPIFGWGVTGSEDEDNIAWCQVSPRDGGFEMRYM